MNTLLKEPRNYMGFWLNKDQKSQKSCRLKMKNGINSFSTKGKHINPSVRNLNEKVYRKNSRKGKLETKITANCKINQANCNEFIKCSNKVFMVTGSREKS